MIFQQANFVFRFFFRQIQTIKLELSKKESRQKSDIGHSRSVFVLLKLIGMRANILF